MQTPVTNRNPLAAVAPPTQQRAASAGATPGGFSDALAREVSQHATRVQDESKSRNQASEGAPDTAAAKADKADKTDKTDKKSDDAGADGAAAPADASGAVPVDAPVAKDAAAPVDAAATSGLLPLVADLTPKAAADGKIEPAVRDAGRDLAVAGRGAVRGEGTDGSLASAIDGRALAGPAAVTAKATRQGESGRALAGEAFGAALGRAGDDAASGEAAGALRLEAIPQGPAAPAPAALNAAGLGVAAAPGGDRLAPRVGTPAWDNALGHRIVWMAGAQEQTASLSLNPPDLGPMQVVLSVSNNHADAMFVATQPEVRQALEAALPRLRDMLGDAGLTLRDATVSADTRDSQQAFQQAQRNIGGAVRADRGADGGSTDTAIASVPVRTGRTLVDTFA